VTNYKLERMAEESKASSVVILLLPVMHKHLGLQGSGTNDGQETRQSRSAGVDKSQSI